MRIYLISLFTILWTSSATAETTIDDVLAALAEQEFSLLEERFAEASGDANEKGDYRPLRQLYFAVFEKANSERFAKTKAWQSAFPQSPFAATALAKVHLKRAFLLRGAMASRYTSPEAFDGFHSELREASRYIEVARRHTPEFVPALDAAVDLAMTGHSGDPLVLVNRLIDAAPDYTSMQFAISALRTNWSGSLRDNIQLCVTMAHKVPDYDAELCLIEVAFANKAKGPLMDAAIEALANRDEPFLDYIRIKVYMTQWRYEPNALEEIQRIHRASLAWNFKPDEFMIRNGILQTTFNLPFFAAEMEEAAMQTLAKWLKVDPQNHRLANTYFRHSVRRSEMRYGEISPELMQDLTDMWPDMLVLGRFSPDVWEVGRQIMAFRRGWHDVVAQLPFVRNRVYFSNHNPSVVRSHMSDLYSVWDVATGGSGSSLTAEQLAGAREEVECPLVRASRIYEAMCKADPRAIGCNIGGWGGIFPEHARRISKNSKKCSAGKDAGIEALVYTPVDISPNIFKEGVQK